MIRENNKKLKMKDVMKENGGIKKRKDVDEKSKSRR
jgi:hypothetical protein